MLTQTGPSLAWDPQTDETRDIHVGRELAQIRGREVQIAMDVVSPHYGAGRLAP